jgi:hypothetical protein
MPAGRASLQPRRRAVEIFVFINDSFVMSMKW